MERSYGLNTLNRLDTLTEPKSTRRAIFKEYQFQELPTLQRIAIPGDESKSLLEPEDSIRNKLDITEAGLDQNQIYLQNQYIIEIEDKAVINTGSNPLISSSSRINFNTQASRVVDNYLFTLNATHFSRNTRFDLQPIIENVKKDLDKRFEKSITVEKNQYSIILHPNVLGRIIAYHSSYYLYSQDRVNQEKQVWNSKYSLFDDPLLDNGYGSEIFDDEGSITKPKQIIESGIFKEQLETQFTREHKTAGNAYRSSWFQPFVRSYDHPIVKSYSNLVITGGIGKGSRFTERSGSIVLIKQGTGYVGGTLREPYFVIHTSEAELWRNGERICPVKNFTINSSVDNILQNGDLSADQHQVVDPAIPGSIHVGWLYLDPEFLK